LFPVTGILLNLAQWLNRTVGALFVFLGVRVAATR